MRTNLKKYTFTAHASLWLTRLQINACNMNYTHVFLLYVYNLSLVMRKPEICLCKNKGADQLRSNCETDQRFCFRYMDSTLPLLSKSEISSISCTDRFVLDLVRNPEDRFSHVAAHL